MFSVGGPDYKIHIEWVSGVFYKFQYSPITCQSHQVYTQVTLYEFLYTEIIMYSGIYVTETLRTPGSDNILLI
jgi:hypothetical protein